MRTPTYKLFESFQQNLNELVDYDKIANSEALAYEELFHKAIEEARDDIEQAYEYAKSNGWSLDDYNISDEDKMIVWNRIYDIVTSHYPELNTNIHNESEKCLTESIDSDIKSFHIENMGGGTMALFGQFTDGRFFAGNEDGLNVYDVDVWPYYEVDEKESGVNWQELEDKHNVETIEAGTELFNNIMRETKFMDLEECEKPLKEDSYTDEIKLYMNTWANYNEYGADTEAIGGGWMTIEQAKEFLDKHEEEEPFINDTDNCPISVSEYDNPWQVIEELENIENIDPSSKDAFLAIYEEHNENMEEAMSILESGDYTFFPGVDNDYDLGKAYYEMVGGIEGIKSPENYVNREYVKQNLINNLNSDEDYSDEELDAMVDEEIEVARIDGNTDFFEDYFDFEDLGRELNYDGFYYAETGAIQTY